MASDSHTCGSVVFEYNCNMTLCFSFGSNGAKVYTLYFGCEFFVRLQSMHPSNAEQVPREESEEECGL